MSPKQRRGQQTAQRILDTALELFGREGPHHFTVHAVADGADVSLGSLYHHFTSFEGLQAALYARCMGDLLDDLGQAMTTAASARAGIEAHTVAYLRFARAQTASARVIHAAAEASFLPSHASAIAAIKAPRMKRMVDWVDAHVQADEIVDLPAPLLEMLIVGPVAETTRRWLAGVPGVDLKQAEQALPERVWRSVRHAHDA